MTLLQAALAFAMRLMDNTNQGMPYNQQVLEDTVVAITDVTEDIQEVETLIRIARWESGGFRKDIATCKVKGDNGAALGLFQVHPITKQEFTDLCSKDYRDQARAALAHVHNSRDICKMHGYNGSALLTIYTNGSCRANSSAARLRWGSGQELQSLVWTEMNQFFF